MEPDSPGPRTEFWSPAGHTGGGQILVIDDEPRLLGLLMRVMRANGIEVRCARDAASGWELIGPKCALVLLDLVMPGEDGFELLPRIHETWPAIPVIVLSAVAGVDAKVLCFELGAADYVTKPFAMAELLARIRRLTAPADASDSRWLSGGGLQLDLHRHEASVGSRVVPLSARECAVLAHLMRWHDRVCSRQELLAEVWGVNFDPGTNVVDVYVRRLRSKLGDDVIVTVRSAGYTYGVA
jgi:DNA-binding response OmpR family regulator